MPMHTTVLLGKQYSRSEIIKCNRPRGHSADTHKSVQEIFGQPENITSASLQPKNISSFHTQKPVHEHKIS